MFEKLKELKKIKDSLAQEKFEAEKGGVKVVLNGNMEVEEVTADENLPKEDLEKTLKECFNEALKKSQKAMAQKFQGMM